MSYFLESISGNFHAAKAYAFKYVNGFQCRSRLCKPTFSGIRIMLPKKKLVIDKTDYCQSWSVVGSFNQMLIPVTDRMKFFELLMQFIGFQ